MALTTMRAALLVSLGLATLGAGDKKPNVIIVLTDDQDILLNSTRFQPNLAEKVISQGMTFSHGLANTPVCCPSRSTLLSGRYTHNHGAKNNSMQGSCSTTQWSETVEKDALAVHMANAGYYSMYAGKYLNHYGQPGTGAGGKEGIAYIPPGWSQWYGLQGNSRYFNYTMSFNGVASHQGNNYSDNYLTDVLKGLAVGFLKDADKRRKANGQPFFMWIGTPAAHASFTPAPQYEDTAKGDKAPRTPSFNQVYQDRHQTVREITPMTEEMIEQTDIVYAQRLGTLRSVDDMVLAIYEQLEAMGEADDTYFFYTGDHGFHLGQFGMMYDKRQLYDTDIRVPYFVRGPGIPKGSVRHEPISHVDLAPTVIDIAAGSVPENWDGKSYKSLLATTGPVEWRTETLIQYFGEGVVESCGSGRNYYQKDSGDNYIAFSDKPYISTPCDGMNNTYTCVRRVTPDLKIDDILCEFTCFHQPGGTPVPCPADQAEGYGEYYDMTKDPWQTVNTARELPADKRQKLSARLEQLRNCQGQKGCE